MTYCRLTRSWAPVAALLLTVALAHRALAQPSATVSTSSANNKDLSVGGALRRSADRNGLWASLGVGRGSAGLQCGACAKESTYAYTLQGSLGMRLTPRVLVGAEMFAWMDVLGGGVDRIARGSYLIARAYSSREAKLFLQGGLGLASFQLKDGGVTFATRSPSGSLTAGYDWRLDGFTVTPSVSAVGSIGGRLQSDKTGNAIADNARLGVLRTSVSLSWYR